VEDIKMDFKEIGLGSGDWIHVFRVPRFDPFQFTQQMPNLSNEYLQGWR
jgi:hypothetical protein